MVYNEAANLDSLLSALTTARTPSAVLEQIVVVSSGSTDASNAIADAWQQRDSRVVLVVESRRRGKAHAINIFLSELPDAIDVCVLVSGDVLPAPGALERLVAPFLDPTVGMTGGRPVPSNPETTLIDRVVRFQWALHHRVSESKPKLGELIAFRKTFARLDSATAVDEASLEAMFTAVGSRLVYIADAVVYNHGPSTLAHFILQRRRIWAGHLWLHERTGYEVSTYRLRRLALPGLREARARGVGFGTVAAAAGLEAVARLLGTWDRMRRHSHTVLTMVDGT